MPVFNLELKFDDKGALVAVRKLDDITDSAQKAEDALKNTGKDGGKAFDNLSKKAEAARKATSLLAKGLKLFVGVSIPLGIVSSINSLISSSSELREQLQGLEKQYQALGARAGWTAQEMAGLEKLMIKNGVDAVQARKNVISLTSAFVDSSKAAPLFAAALDSTVLSGKSVEDSLQGITQAIESGNVKSLEALGIYANFNAAYESMATKLGTTVVALTEQEKAQARVDATLEAAAANAGLFEEALTETERAQNAMQESLTALEIEIGEAFGFETTDLIYGVANAVKWLGDMVNKVRTAFSGLGAVIRGELSVAQYLAMDQKQIKEHLSNYTNADWLKKMQSEAKAKMASLSSSLSESSIADYQKAEQEYKFYSDKLVALDKKRQEEQKQLNIAERQQQAKHNQDMAELLEKSRQNQLLRDSKTQEGRVSLAEKSANDQLAIEKRLYENGVITQDEYKKRSLSIEKDKQAKLAAIEKAYAGKKGGTVSSGGASGKTDAAIRQLENYTRQIDILNGTSSRAAQQLEKVLEGIESTGRAAGLSASEIEKIKAEYAEAFKADVLTKFDKELLRVQGNTAALKEIEIAEKMREWNAQFTALGISAAEAAPKLQAMQEALSKQQKVEDLQSAVSFMKDLESLGGSYGLAIQKQNELIEYQAALYRDKLPSDMQPYIDQWERLKKFENDTSFMAGLQRGVRKFGADYGDLASQVESLTTQMGSTIGNTLSDAFMKGKLSAQDFFSSLISMAAQAASNYFIGMLFKGIGGMFSSTASADNAAIAEDTTSAFFKAGGYHKGGIVGKDYTFKRDVPYYVFSDAPRFHSGGGFFRKDEYPAILQSGERVLNRDETRAYQAGMAAGGHSDNANFGRIIAEMQSQMREDRQYMGNNMPIINLNIENNSNAQVQAGQMRPDGNGGFSMDIIISQVEQGIVGRMKSGKSQIAQYQEKTYGMNRAGVIARGRGRN